MALPHRILMNKNQLSAHLGISPAKVSLYSQDLDRYEAVEGSSSHAETFLLRDFVESLLSGVVKKAKGDGGEDAKERAEKARAVKIETDNAIRLGQYVSLEDIIENQAQKAVTVARGLDAVVPNLKRKHPDIPAQLLSSVQDEIDRARNALADQLKFEVSQLGEEAAKAEMGYQDDDIFG